MRKLVLLIIFLFSAFISKAQLTASVSSSTSTSCAGACDGAASVSASGGTPMYTYLWNDPGNQTTSIATALCAGSYTVTVTDAMGATATASVFITEPSPVVLVASPSDTICIGQLAQIYGAGSGGTSPYTYVWNPSSFGTTGGPFMVTPSSTTSYTVAVTDANGCAAPSETVTIFVYPPLSAFPSADVTICNGNSTTISATAFGGNGGPYIYTWSPVGTSGSSVTVSPTATTTYTVTADDGCSPTSAATVTVTVDPCTGIQSQTSENLTVNVFPNPFTNQTTIDLNTNYKNATLKIIDVLGKELKNINFSGKQVILEIEGLNKGIYFIQIVLEEKIVASKKIIVQ